MKKKFNNKGIGLIILTLVILVVGLLISILLQYVNVDLAITKNQKTKDKLKGIREAIEIFVLKNGRFPCPASFTKVPSDAEFGVEQRAGGECDDTDAGIFVDVVGSPTKFYGTVPVRTIDLADDYMIDKWNNKIGYVVSASFTTENSLSYNLENDVLGDLDVGDVQYGIYLVISYGKDSIGAYNKDTAFTSDSSLINNDFSDTEFEGGDDIVVIEEVEDITEKNKEQLTTCDAEINVSTTLYNSGGTEDGSTLMDFALADYGETIYSDQNCPKTVSDPVLATDEYYMAYDTPSASTPNDIDKIGRICGKYGDWLSGFIGVCKAFPKCTLPSTVGSRAVTWSGSPPTYIVNTGEVSGTFDDNSQPVTIKCNIADDGTPSWYIIEGELAYYCDSGIMSNYGNATWNETITYYENDVATATGCQTGYTENAGGAATMICTASGWGSVTNPCVPVTCSKTSPVYDIYGTQIMNTTLDQIIYEATAPSVFNKVNSCIFNSTCYSSGMDFSADYGETAYCATSCATVSEVDWKTFVCSVDGSNNPIWEYQRNACTYSSIVAAEPHGTYDDPGQTAVREGISLGGSCDSGYSTQETAGCASDTSALCGGNNFWFYTNCYQLCSGRAFHTWAWDQDPTDFVEIDVTLGTYCHGAVTPLQNYTKDAWYIGYHNMGSRNWKHKATFVCCNGTFFTYYFNEWYEDCVPGCFWYPYDGDLNVNVDNGCSIINPSYNPY